MRTGERSKIKIQTKKDDMIFKLTTICYAHTLDITDQPQKNTRVTGIVYYTYII